MKKILLALAMVLFLCTSVQAGTYYVGTKANAAANMADQGATAWTNATSSSTPCSIGTAMKYAAAGDTVYFKGGTYEVIPCYVEGPYVPGVYPCNDGTSDTNRITFANAPGEAPILNNSYSSNPGTWNNACSTECGETSSQRGGAILGTWDNSWVTISGFKTTGTNWGGSVFINSSDNVIFENNEVVGNNITVNYLGVDTGNYDGIRVFSSNNITVRNNLVHGWRLTNGDHGNNIKLYNGDDSSFYNNTLYDSNAGVVDKSGGNNNQWYKNFVYGIQASGESYGIMGGEMSSYGACTNALIHDNVIYGPQDACIRSYYSGATSSGWQVYNNTCYDSSGGDGIKLDTCTSCTAWNNIVYNYSTPFDGVTDSYSYTTDPSFSDSTPDTTSDDTRLTSGSPSSVKTGGRGGAYAIYKGAWNPTAKMWVGYCAAGLGGCDVYGDTSYGTPPSAQGCTISGATFK